MLVIIHGWSDTRRSFVRLAQRLAQEGVDAPVTHIRLGDYITLDDDVTFDDLTAAMMKAWLDAELPTAPRSIDAIVHSTGGLVVRHWMTTHFTPQTNPLRRLVMLAPANFGSPLAHKGRSFVGRVVKGFKSDKPFQTGTHILKGLEMASPFSWDLAMRDRFTPDPWYGPDRVLATVIVGNSGYTGIAAAANESGSDGTVRVSTANLDPARVVFDFATDPQNPPRPRAQPAAGRVAFARVNPENHSTVALKDSGPRDERTLDLIRRALTVTDATFPAHVERLDAHSRDERERGSGNSFTQAYQNTVVRLRDDENQPIPDYFLELFVKQTQRNRPDAALTAFVQERIFGKVHTYSDDPSTRSLSFNVTVLQRFVAEHQRPLYLSITAMPDINKTRSVGYRTFGYNDIGSIRLDPELIADLFQPDRTLLVVVRLRRDREDAVFRFHPMP